MNFCNHVVQTTYSNSPVLFLANASFQNIVSRRGVAPLDGKVAMFIETESHIVAFKKKTPIGNVKDALDDFNEL